MLWNLGLILARGPGGEYTWVAGSYLSTRLVLPQNFNTGSSGYANHWTDWLEHQRWVEGGRQREEPPQGRVPPPEWQRYIKARNDWVEAPSDAEFNRIGREVWSQHAELLPVIGTVGRFSDPLSSTTASITCPPP